jgi:hypothetical protein
MFTELTVSSILTMVMVMFGDLFTVIAVASASAAAFGRLLGLSRRRLVEPIGGAIFMTLFCTAGLIARIVSGETDLPNGFIFGFNSWVIALLLILTVLLVAGSFTLPRLFRW